MLEYLTDIIADSQDLGWPSAKGAHAVLLCKMEQDKIQWHETTKIDRVRRVHAQKVGRNSNYYQIKQTKPVPCKYYQKGTCGQTKDHKNNGQLYLTLSRLSSLQKLVTHCKAVSKIEVLNNEKVVFPSRIFVNGTQCISPSVNWKRDWWWFKMKSFAQIVKHNCTNTVVHKVKNVLENCGQSSVPAVTKMHDFDKTCRKILLSS